MYIIGAVKVILIFPFIIYFLLYLMTKNKKQSFLLVSPIYLVSLTLILRYIFGTIVGIISLLVVLIGLAYITIGLNRHKVGTLSKFIRAFLITTGRMYPILYMAIFIMGVIQEYVKIR